MTAKPKRFEAEMFAGFDTNGMIAVGENMRPVIFKDPDSVKRHRRYMGKARANLIHRIALVRITIEPLNDGSEQPCRT